MKKTVAILLLAVFILPNLSRLGIYINFKLHQQHITQVFCVNKERPELECYGKCYLSQQLKEADEKAPQNLSLTFFQKLQAVVTYFECGDFSVFTYLRDIHPRLFFEADNFYSSLYVKGVFHPPK